MSGGDPTTSMVASAVVEDMIFPGLNKDELQIIFDPSFLARTELLQHNLEIIFHCQPQNFFPDPKFWCGWAAALTKM